jgi:DNA polymerase III alpha subunit (gram-positive type)
MKSYVLYVCDTETTGLDSVKNDVIELSLCRLSDNVQKTWHIKPTNFNNIEADALRINGHKKEDITHQTKYGRETYKDASNVIIEIENWLFEDNMPVSNRIIVGQNAAFDKEMLIQLWTKCNSKDTFPFGRRILDTMQIEFFLDWCKDSLAEGYSLNNLVKKYGIKNEKAHTAAADVKATKEVFEKQVEYFKKVLMNEK